MFPGLYLTLPCLRGYPVRPSFLRVGHSREGNYYRSTERYSLAHQVLSIASKAWIFAIRLAALANPLLIF
jgi:hypothetical protein